MFKIKGKGERREVYDGTILVGRLVRHEKPRIETTQRFTNGHAVSATIRKVVEVWWRAYDADERRLGRGDPWRGASKPTLKAWTDPLAWAGLTTKGDVANGALDDTLARDLGLG